MGQGRDSSVLGSKGFSKWSVTVTLSIKLPYFAKFLFYWVSFKFFWTHPDSNVIYVIYTSELPKYFLMDSFLLGQSLSFHEIVLCRTRSIAQKTTWQTQNKPIVEHFKQWYQFQTVQKRINSTAMRQSLAVRQKGKCALSESTNHDPDQWNVITQQIAPRPFSRANEEELIPVLLIIWKGNVLILYNFLWREGIKCLVCKRYESHIYQYINIYQ